MIDSLFAGIMVFVLIVSLLLAIQILTSVSQPLSETIPFFSEYGKMSLALKYLIFGVYFGIPLVALVMAYLSGSDPIFLAISIPLLTVSILIFGIIKAVSIEITNALPAALQIVSGDPVLSNLFEYYPLIMFIFGVAIILVQMIKGYAYE